MRKFIKVNDLGAVIGTVETTDLDYPVDISLIEVYDGFSEDLLSSGYCIINGDVVNIGPRPSSYMIIKDGRWIDPRTPATQWPIVRSQRDRLLQASDWTQLPDVPLTTKEAWASYRQALRDVTLQPDPFNITWPQPPQ